MNKTNTDVLNNFGKIIIDEIYNRYRDGIYSDIFCGIKNPTEKKYEQIFEKLGDEQKGLLLEYFKENIESIMFDFLRIFEENEGFKLIYEENGKQVNLADISENLKAEPIIENGWIDRFGTKNEL